MQKDQKKEKRIKLLYITEFFPTSVKIDIHGGVEMRTFLIARELAKKYDVAVITSNLGKETKPFYLDYIKVIPVGVKRSYVNCGDYLNRLTFMLSALFKSLTESYDLIEAAGFVSYLPGLISGLVKNKTRVAFVPDTLSSSSEFNSLERFIVKLYEHIILYTFWSKYIVISKFVKKKLSNIIKNTSLVKVIYCPVKITKNNLNSKTSYPSIIYTGRLVGYKRVSDLIYAVSEISKNVPDIRCNIIGSGPEHKNLKSVVKKLKIANFIKFLGYLNDHDKVIHNISSAWVFCQPSTYEGFGIATIEAMSVGTPFVLPDNQVNREVTNSKGGLFYKPQSVKDLSIKLNELIKKGPILRNKIIKYNYNVVCAYDIKEISKQTEKLYLPLIKKSLV